MTSRSPRIESADNETTGLLSDKNVTEEDEDEALQSTNRRGLALITTIITLYMCNFSLSALFMDEYLFKHFAKDVFGNRTVDTTRHPCVNESSGNESSQAGVTKVQALTSQTNLYLDLTSYGLGMVSNALLGTYSAVMSRKLLLMIPIVGTLIKSCTIFVVIFWSLDINWLFIGYTAEGICGNLCGMLFSSMLYTSDITPRDRRRVVGVTVLEGVKGAIPAGFNIVAGMLIEHSGFIAPAGVGSGCLFIAVLLVFFLPDCKPRSLEKESQNLWTVRGSLKNMVHPYFFHPTKRVRHLIILGTLSFFPLELVRFGVSKFRNLFYMHYPLCFDAVTLGWFSFGREFSFYVFSIVAVMLFYKKLPGLLLGIAGVVSQTGGYLLYAFAVNRTQTYIGPVITLGQSLPACTLRGEMSRILGPESQGPLFASLAVIESIAFAASPPMFLSIYKASLTVYMGTAWLVAAVLMFALVIPMGIFQMLWRKHFEDETTQTLSVNGPEEPDDQKQQEK